MAKGTIDKGIGGSLPKFVGDKELAAYLGKSPRTLARWRRLGEGPPVTRVGRKLVYRLSAVEAWLKAQEEIPDHRDHL